MKKGTKWIRLRSMEGFDWRIYERLCDGCAGKFIGTVEGCYDESKEFAELIAAAPEMLDALKPIGEEIKDKHGDFSEDNWNKDYHVEITLTVSEARAVFNAIKKAEGEK